MRGALPGLIAILVAIAVFRALKPLWIKRDYDRTALAGLMIGVLPLALPVVIIGIVLICSERSDIGHFQTDKIRGRLPLGDIAAIDAEEQEPRVAAK
jgi:hypothetical protein